MCREEHEDAYTELLTFKLMVENGKLANSAIGIRKARIYDNKAVNLI